MNIKYEAIKKFWSIITFFVSAQGWFILGASLLDVLSFTLNIVFIIKLYQTSGLLQEPAQIHVVVYTFLSLLVLNAVLEIAKIYADANIKKLTHHKIYTILENHFLSKQLNAVLHRLVLRNLQIILEYSPLLARSLALLAILVFGLPTLYCLPNTEPTIITSALIFFAPIAFCISWVTARLAPKIFDASKRRSDLAMRLLKFRAYFLNWRITTPLSKLKILSEQELKHRSCDSIWRALDNYLIVFSRLFPSLLFAAYLANKPHALTPPSTLTIWLTVPFMGLLMELGRCIAELGQLYQSVAEILQLRTDSLHTDTQKIQITPDWEIWSGTLRENILLSDKLEYLDLYQKFRLKDELTTNSDALETQLDYQGNNISAGQRTRVLLLRGIHLALITNKPLEIDIGFESLDYAIARTVYTCIKDLQDELQIDFEQKTLHQLSSRISQSPEHPQRIVPKDTLHERDKVKDMPVSEQNQLGIWQIYSKFLSYPALFFIPIAYYLNWLTTAIESVAGSPFIAIVSIGITCVVIGLATGLGARLENTLRRSAIFKQRDVLQSGSHAKFDDLVQIVTRDLTVIMERVAWYIHDLAWYQAILAIAILVVVTHLKAFGLITLSISLSLMILTIRLGAPSVNRFRQEIVGALNDAIQCALNINASAGVKGGVIQSLIRKWSDSCSASIIGSHLRLFFARQFLAYKLKLIMNLTLITSMFGFYYFNARPTEWIVTGSALLNVNQVIVNFAFALIGLNSHYWSYHRLKNFPKSAPLALCQCVNQNDKIIIEKVRHPVLNFAYRPLSLSTGRAYSLQGPSGYGKTEYLRTICGYYDCYAKSDLRKIFYIDSQHEEITEELHISSLEELLTQKITSPHYQVYVLDEATLNKSVQEVKQLVRRLEPLLTLNQKSLLLVDHRIDWQHSLRIENIIINSKESSA